MNQSDDGSREALRQFFMDRDENLKEFINLFRDLGQYWKARVLMELTWEFESKRVSNGKS